MSRRLFVLSALLAVSVAAPARAQYADAHVLPRGTLRVSFEPAYIDARFRFAADGTLESLGADFSDTAAGARLFPTSVLAQTPMRALLADSTYRMIVGSLATTRDADIRRTPFNFALGLSSRLTLTASVPFVTTRSQVSVALDSTNANVGWNQAGPAAGNADAAALVAALLAQLNAAAAYVDAQIAAGNYGCPGSASCADAEAALARAQSLASGLSAMSGVAADGSVASIVPPFAPLSGSAAGAALTAAIQQAAADLAALGAPAVTGAYPLPSTRLGADDINTLVTSPGYGYGADPLEFSKYRNALGDVEVGFRFAALGSSKLRAVAVGTVRLPTGKRDSPDHYLDIGSGDRQTDLIGGLEAAWDPGKFVTLSASATYTMQLPDVLTRRVAPHTSPIAPLSTETTVHRNLGDEIDLALYPGLRLSSSMVAYGAMRYRRKSADRYTYQGSPAVGVDGAPLDAGLLGFETATRRLSFGGGIAYRGTHGRQGPTLPVEAGIDYQAVFSGSGGQAWKTVRVGFYLRLFYHVFGGSGEQ